MRRKDGLTDRELLFFSILVSFVLFYLISVILLLTAVGVSGWDAAGAGLIALLAPVVLSQLLYRWTVS